MSSLTVTPASETDAVTTNARTQILPLNPGRNRVGCFAASWDGSKTLSLIYFPKNDSDSETDVLDDSYAQVEFTANGAVDIYGPGFICGDITSTDGVGVKLYVQQLGLMG